MRPTRQPKIHYVYLVDYNVYQIAGIWRFYKNTARSIDLYIGKTNTSVKLFIETHCEVKRAS